MAICCCDLAGTAACQHCRNNPFATEVWTNKTITVDHVEVRPFGDGLDVCPVCGKPSTIGKPLTKADRIRSMMDEELASCFARKISRCYGCEAMTEEECKECVLDWLKSPATKEAGE